MSSYARSRRCILFFPGSRPERYGKAVATGVDAVCLDLEDAVAITHKDEAREHMLGVLAGRSETGAELIVRINHPASPEGARDLEALCGAQARPDAIMIPKASAPEDVLHVEDSLGRAGFDVPLIPLIETARGLHRSEDLALASRAVSGLLLGGVDLSTELGSSRDWDAMLYARSRVVHAAALARVGAIDMPRLDVKAVDELRHEARAARRLGFVGKAAIHPDHVGIIQAAFSPTQVEVQRAEAILHAFEAQTEGSILSGGQMIDRPVLEAARRVVQAAAQNKKSTPDGTS